jgi:DNA-binding CsgD family transcriptional regulator
MIHHSRNVRIFKTYLDGLAVVDIAKKFELSRAQTHFIIRRMKDYLGLSNANRWALKQKKNLHAQWIRSLEKCV